MREEPGALSLFRERTAAICRLRSVRSCTQVRLSFHKMLISSFFATGGREGGMGGDTGACDSGFVVLSEEEEQEEGGGEEEDG